jgi:PilZ domain
MASRLAPAPACASLDHWSNRRVYIRRPCGGQTSARVAAGSKRPRQARIQDISLGGVALVSRQPIRVGTRLLIQVKNEDLGIAYDLSARVVHATPKTRAQWILGCEFARALSEPELETLL